ncbi:MAG: AAA family ATPase, partial [Candidatus Aegiribacteria sp.]|nr:AAA family ATPase [Candidatus Aegiribacteria sp.]
TGVIYGIEEPETSQHPNNQRMLLRALSDLSSEAQVVISTHTPMLARAIQDKCLRYININEEGDREILIGGPDTNEIFIDALGVLPDNSVKLFIAVEGPRDISFLQSIACALIEDGVDVPNLEELEKEGKVIFIPLGGSTLARWANRLEPLRRPEFHLCDRDTEPPEAPKYNDHINSVNEKDNCRALCTGKREIENYIHYKTISEAYQGLGISIDIENSFGPFEDVPMEIAKLVHEQSDSHKNWDELPDKTKSKKESKAKDVLCKRATRNMTSALLDEIDQDGDVISWFSHISNVLVADEEE